MRSHAPLAAERLDALARAYRRMVGSFGLQLVAMALVVVPLGDAARSHPTLGRALAILFTVSVWASAACIAYYAFRTAKVLGSFVGWLCVVLIALPYPVALANALVPGGASDGSYHWIQLASSVGFLALLSLSAMATRACKAAGLRVGLLGPAAPAKPTIPA